MLTNKPSPQLLDLLKNFADKLTNARDLWDQLRLMGANEGFDEHQSAEMVRPFLKERGLTKDKIFIFLIEIHNYKG